jgi:hypothetical protein
MKETRFFHNQPFAVERPPTPNSKRIRVEITWEELGAKRVKIRYDYIKALTQARFSHPKQRSRQGHDAQFALDAQARMFFTSRLGIRTT